MDAIHKISERWTNPNPKLSQHSEKSDEEKEYWKRVFQPEKTMHYISDPEFAWKVIFFRANAILKQTGKTFIVDKANSDFLKTLILYFTNHPEFESIKPGYKLCKGLWLRGSFGTGKTFTMQLFSNNLKGDKYFFNNSYFSNHFVACSDVLIDYRDNGPSSLQPYTRSSYLKTKDNWTPLTYCFDELTEKNTVNYFGNHDNVMQEILEFRYRKYIEQGMKTHITTNLVDADQVESLYGGRLRSRIREMFNVIDVDGIDRRF